MTDQNRQYLMMMEDLFRAGSGLNIKIYIWGGFSLDIREGRFLREHGENLIELEYFMMSVMCHYLAVSP